MEHLLGHGTSPQFAPGTTIPWLGFDHYAQETTTFDLYLRNRGWDFKELLDGTIKVPHDELSDATDKTPATRAAAAIQSWLYFGFLEGILESRIQPTLFEKFLFTHNDGSVTLHSGALFDVLSEWIPYRSKFCGFEDKDRLDASLAVYRETFQVASKAYGECWNSLAEFTQADLEMADLVDKILPSVYVMLETVYEIAISCN